MIIKIFFQYLIRCNRLLYLREFGILRFEFSSDAMRNRKGNRDSQALEQGHELTIFLV